MGFIKHAVHYEVPVHYEVFITDTLQTNTLILFFSFSFYFCFLVRAPFFSFFVCSWLYFLLTDLIYLTIRALWQCQETS